MKPQDITNEQLIIAVQTEKDLERSNGLQWRGNSFYGNSAPFAGKTRSQLKAIKDPMKLVRRCKAFIMQYGYGESVGYSGGEPVEKDRIDIGLECESALRKIGFSYSQVETIRKSANK
jgi:hypothetical protein